MSGPQIAQWNVTPQCDYSCPFCFMKNVKEPLNFENRTWILDKLKAGDVESVTFTGGEPLLASDLDILLHHAVEINIGTALVTNASRLTQERLKEIAPYLGAIMIGLDAVDADLADKMRGEPGHGLRAMQAIQWAVDMGLNVGIMTTVTQHNLEHLKTMAYAVQNILPPTEGSLWVVSEFSPIGEMGGLAGVDLMVPPGLFAKTIENLPDITVPIWPQTREFIADAPYFEVDHAGNVSTYSVARDEDVTVGSLNDFSVEALWEKVQAHSNNF